MFTFDPDARRARVSRPGEALIGAAGQRPAITPPFNSESLSVYCVPRNIRAKIDDG